MSHDLVTQLKEQAFSDHVRGCEGRQYSCDCGYDIRTEGLLEQAAQALTEARAEIERLRESAKGQLAIVQQAIAERKQAESELSTLRARVREVVGQMVDLTEDFKVYGPAVVAARQLMEELK